MGKKALAQGSTALQTRENESDRAEHKPSAGASSNAHDLFAVDGEIVAKHAEAETEENHIDAQQPATLEKETVQRKRALCLHGSFLWQLHRRVNDESEGGDDECEPEEQLEIMRLGIDEDGERRCDGHREIVAESVVANAFVATGRGEYIDGNGGVGDGECAERTSVEGSDDGKQQ